MSSTESESSESLTDSQSSQRTVRASAAAPLATISKMTSIGKLEAFDESQESWTNYAERLEQYFIANEVSEEKKVPALLSLIGPKTYALLRDLTTLDKPSSKMFTDLVTTLDAHLAPKPLVIAERFRFHKRNQKQGESVNRYAAELRKLSEHCEFGTNLKDSLRDRCVCGLAQENIQKRLLTEDKLTFDKAVEIALSMEIASRDAVELQSSRGHSSVASELNKMDLGRQRHRVAEKCYRCNREGHRADDCRFREETCHKCKRRGHSH